MAPRIPVASLQAQAFRSLKHILDQVLFRIGLHNNLSSSSSTPMVEAGLKLAQVTMQEYICTSLPASLQAQLLSQLIGDHQLKYPQLILHLLFTPRLQRLSFQLTKPPAGGEAVANSLLAPSERERLVRVSEDDLSRCLAVLDNAFVAEGAENFALESFYMTDASQDPDFQGDPINNMTNTNLSIRYEKDFLILTMQYITVYQLILYCFCLLYTNMLIRI
jgi:hypothetical protein